MRHLVICYHTCPLDEPGTNLAGGMNIFLRGLLPALHGFETEVWTRGERDETVAWGPGLKLRRVACGFSAPWNRERAHACLSAFVQNAPRDFQPQVISAHYWMSGVAARSLFPEVPTVLAYHTLQATKGQVPDPLGRRVAEERLAAEASRVVFFSSLDQRVSSRLLPPLRATVIRPGFTRSVGRADRARFGLPERSLVFLVAARDDPGKNLAAARRAVLGCPEAVLAIAGQTGPAEERVRYLGSLPHHEMAALYASVDAVLCPSDYETFGLVTWEALAAGRPVVVTPGGYWARVLAFTGCGLVAPLPGLGAAVRRLARDPDLRDSLRQRGLALAERYDPDRCAVRWGEVLREATR